MEKNKLFTRLLVYGFLISLTVPIYRTFKYIASDDYAGKDYIESKIEIPPSPRENYINPDLWCTYENADYQSPYKFADNRYCVDEIENSFYEVNWNDQTAYRGHLNKVTYGSNDDRNIREYTIENNQLVLYICIGYRVCNGQSDRRVIAIKRN